MPSFRGWPAVATCLLIGLVVGLAARQELIGQPLPPPNPVIVPPRDLTSFSPIVKRVLPAVVSIDTKLKSAPTRVGQTDEPGFGSGVIIDPTGVVVTNNHVLENAESAVVTLADGRKVTSKEFRRDPKSDLAIILLGMKDPVPFLEFTDSDLAEVGDRVLAVGAPYGLAGSVTHGIISAKSRNNLRLNLYEDFIQTDAAVNPGNSGGPLISMDAKILGLTAAIKTRSGGSQGVCLAVSSNLLRAVTGQLMKEGVVRRAYLGASVREFDPELDPKNGVTGGAIVTRVYDSTPAATAGLAAGDAIVTVAGQPVRDSRGLQKLTTAMPLKEAYEVGIIRGGKPMTLKVIALEQPSTYGNGAQSQPPAASSTPVPAPAPPPAPAAQVTVQSIGLAVADLSPELAARMGYAVNTKGVVILAVTKDGIADKCGLKVGQVVTKVDKTEVPTAAAFGQAIAAANPEKGASLEMLKANGEVEFAVLKLQ